MSTISANATRPLLSKHYADDPVRLVTYRLLDSHWRKRKNSWPARLKDFLLRRRG